MQPRPYVAPLNGHVDHDATACHPLSASIRLQAQHLTMAIQKKLGLSHLSPWQIILLLSATLDACVLNPVFPRSLTL